MGAPLIVDATMDATLLGYCAAFLTTASFLPQVIHTVRSRDTRSISLTMYLMFVSGVAAWLAYGIRIAATPVIIANALTLLLSSLILLLKIRDLLRARKNAP